MTDTVPQPLPVSGLAEWSLELRRRARNIRGLAGIAAQAATLLGVSGPANPGEVATVVRAVGLAAAAGGRVLAFITPELADRNSSNSVAAAAGEIAARRARCAALAEAFRIPATARPDDLRRHAAALREAGPFGFLHAATRAAERCHAGLRSGPDSAGRRAMAAALVSIAEHLEALPALAAKPEYRAAFGNRFQGLATDTDAALAVVAWAARVRTDLAGVDPVTAGARRTLLSGDQDRLEAIAAFAAGAAFAALRAHVGSTGTPPAPFDLVAAALDASAAAAVAVAAACESCGITGSVLVADLPDLCRRTRRTQAAATAARLPGALAAALGESLPQPRADLGPFQAACALAAAVGDLPVCGDGRRVLQAMLPADIRDRVVPLAQALVAKLDRALGAWHGIADRLGMNESAFLGGPPAQASPACIADRLERAAGHGDQLGGWIACLMERRAAAALGLGALLDRWDEKVISGPLAAAFNRVLYRALARHAFARHPEFDRFTGLGLDEAQARFKALDRQATGLFRRWLAGRLADCRVPKGNRVGRKSEYTESALILLELGKQGRHIAIRKLLDRAGVAIQALKPCFMMSPLSVAQYLKPGGPRFDLLVIDEASQMRPEDAVGAIARCGQIVVVGDPKQLPPTSFFARMDGGADDDDIEDEEVDAESILDLAQTVFRPMRRLRWHYRSRHGSLIAFSNREFYDDDMIVFPSPAEAKAGQGVTATRVDGIYKARSNLAEVTAVCDAAIAHMRDHPERSLGIATINQVQRDLIALEMDGLATLHSEIGDYRQCWSGTLERFFVKNLENVQGDERDVIFVSTVFGPSEPGGRQGEAGVRPHQRQGTGHRRLNVLFTRAKRRVHLFTSMTPDDVLAGQNSPRGARVLKAYLAYASAGRLETWKVPTLAGGSEFEPFLRNRLCQAGYDAVPRLGVAGFFIDLAVRDPDVPERFLLGILGDGASCQATRSARDREILRRNVLEGLGWTIFRVWSAEWFRDPAGQTEKLIMALEHMRRERPSACTPGA